MSVKLVTMIIVNYITVHFVPVSLVPSVSVPRVAMRTTYPNCSTSRIRGHCASHLHKRLVRINNAHSVHDRSHTSTNDIIVAFRPKVSVSLLFVRIGRGVSHTVGGVPHRFREPGIVGTNTVSVPTFCLSV